MVSGADFVMYPSNQNTSGVFFGSASEARAAAKADPGATVWNDRKGTFLFESKAKTRTCPDHGRYQGTTCGLGEH